MPEEIVSRINGNWRTTMLGILAFLFAVAMIVAKILCWAGKLNTCDFSVGQIITTLLVSYGLIMAKDTFLEGISWGLFKLKKSSPGK